MFGQDKPPLPIPPQAPSAPPTFGSQTAAKKPQAKSMTPTFLGTGTVPAATGVGQKTLIGS